MKAKIGTEMTKEEEAFASTPLPVWSDVPQAPSQQTTVMVQSKDTQVDHSGATCWYVMGILSSIFCCPIFGLVGLVHAMLAKHEGEKGNVATHKRRLYQAKCWTSWSIAVGLFFFILFVIFAAMVMSGHSGGRRSRHHGERGFGGYEGKEGKYGREYSTPSNEIVTGKPQVSPGNWMDRPMDGGEHNGSGGRTGGRGGGGRGGGGRPGGRGGGGRGGGHRGGDRGRGGSRGGEQ